MTDHQHPSPISREPLQLGLTILAHPYADRVGQVLHLTDSDRSRQSDASFRVNRVQGVFHDPFDPRNGAPLERERAGVFQNFVSEARPLIVSLSNKTPQPRILVSVDLARGCACELSSPGYHTLYATPSSEAAGEHLPAATDDPDERQLVRWLRPVHSTRTYTVDELDQGIVLLYSRHVALVLHRWTPFDAQDEELSKRTDALTNRALSPKESESLRFGRFIGQSAAFRELRKRLAQVALEMEPNSRGGRRFLPVLLLGETGTGKLPASQLLHLLSERPGPWVMDDLSGQETDLAFLKLRLFGGTPHGKSSPVVGLADKADGGTLLLDEIANVDFKGQEVILSLAQHGLVVPMGTSASHFVDVRVVGATNKPEAAIKHDLVARFRETIRLPPLRDRRDDIGRLLVSELRARLRDRVANQHLIDEPSREGNWLPAALVAAFASAPLKQNVRAIERLASHLLMRFASEPRCSLVECAHHLDDAGTRGTASIPVQGIELSPALLRKRFEELGWFLAGLTRETGEDEATLRRRLKEGGYKFLDDRVDEVFETLRRLSLSEEPPPIDALVPMLQARKKTIREFLSKKRSNLITSGVSEKWLDELRRD